MNPKKLTYVKNQMDKVLYSVNYSMDLFEPSVAYTYARTKSLCGTVYQIFVNNTDSELTPFLFMHECGHVIFGHCKNMDARMNRFLLSKISAAYSKISKFFPNYQEYLEIFRSMIFNIVMDFEVNSRLFSLAEWKFMNLRFSELIKTPNTQGFWPQDYGFPPELTWNEYLNLILLNPEEFLQSIRKTINSKARRQSDFNGIMTQEEFEKHLEKCKNEPLSNKELEELKKLSNEHNKSTFDVPNGQMNGKSDTSNSTVHIHFKTFDDMNTLVRQIMKLLQIENRNIIRRDIMYNSNRRKINSNVIVPKELQNTAIQNKNLYILIDVSGSVNPKMIFDFISSFKQIEEHFNKTQIISWNTQLVNQWTIKEPIPNNYGGGTCISTGIDYIHKNFNLTHKDALFVISDFNDNLSAWSRSLANLKCKSYAINWNPKKPSINPGFVQILQYSKQSKKKVKKQIL